MKWVASMTRAQGKTSRILRKKKRESNACHVKKKKEKKKKRNERRPLVTSGDRVKKK